jgi:negative regulator of sigma E activity
MAADKSLSEKWESYHLIKSCLQRQSGDPLVIDVADRVCQELSQQNSDTSGNFESDTRTSSLHNWLKPVLGMGIAASVAFMSVFLIQNKNDAGVISNEQPTIALQTGLKPLPVNISANMVSGSQAIVSPPASLSRFPSVSAKNTFNYNQGFSQTNTMPYLIILNQDEAKNQLTPLRINNISD